MFAKFNLWIIRRRLAISLHREASARNRMGIERRRMAELENRLENVEIAVLTDQFYRDAGY
jgi:hypothetical protein